jgi:hypothetical protein
VIQDSGAPPAPFAPSHSDELSPSQNSIIPGNSLSAHQHLQTSFPAEYEAICDLASSDCSYGTAYKDHLGHRYILSLCNQLKLNAQRKKSGIVIAPAIKITTQDVIDFAFQSPSTYPTRKSLLQRLYVIWKTFTDRAYPCTHEAELRTVLNHFFSEHQLPLPPFNVGWSLDLARNHPARAASLLSLAEGQRIVNLYNKENQWLHGCAEYEESG